MAAEEDEEEKRLSPPVVFLSVGGGGGDKVQAQPPPPRLPRWTRQELLVLIQGKRVAENRVRRGIRTVSSSSGQGQGQMVVEPKWSSVSSYCKRHGVNRGPVQCRKRWSNLAGDFKKIHEWESHINDETESFWLMRNDLRRDRKLPGFFDREVYDILLNGPADHAGDKSLVLSLAPSVVVADTQNHQVVFDSGRPDDGLFSDQVMMTTSPDKEPPPAAAPTPISATRYEPLSQQDPPLQPASTPAPAGDKETTPSPKNYQGKKRKRSDIDANEDMSLHNQLIEAMERNGRLLTSQLEIQNTNSQLDREQRKDHADSLFAVLNKLADAMVRIADKL
uniref:trihelix transcription factor ASR3 n=1 Tax=Erigeron canadensis TaxID=72917 RepID=UPI001CB8F680|nr:trihelix transcription factor ASR3 [Erigeron canadensis]